MWVKAAYGDEAGAIWAELADNIVTVTPGWSEAYGLFLEGEADLVLSYTTSPAYHLIAEEDAGKVALSILEAHGVPCACYSHMSARIGDAQDGYEHGIVTEMNNLARLKGVGLAMTVKDAANLLNQL